MKKPINDEFRGDTEHLRASIKALIEMEDDGVLVPHGIGGHARALLASSYHRLPKPKARGEFTREYIGIAIVVAISFAVIVAMAYFGSPDQ